MKKLLLTVQSVTLAMKGKEILTRKGIPATVKRTPKLSQTKSCGYSIAVPRNYKQTAVEMLAQNGIAVTDVSEGSFYDIS